MCMILQIILRYYLASCVNGFKILFQNGDGCKYDIRGVGCLVTCMSTSTIVYIFFSSFLEPGLAPESGIDLRRATRDRDGGWA